jgi:ABC-2 type transport system ATP-binding protein
MKELTKAPLIRMQAVHKRYGHVEALGGIDLAVGPGEVVALLGPNGAGKTTAFEVLLGLVEPSGGIARVLGASPGTAARSRTGAMLQGAGLPDQGTVGELVRLVARSYPASLPVDETLARVGLLEKERRTVAVLSGGERQRLLLAMATVAAPELLLLDEPTAAMDVQSRRAFWAHAREAVRDGATILFATHDLAEADEIADRVVVLQHGRVIADSTPAELKRRVTAAVIELNTDAPLELLHALPGVEQVEGLHAAEDGASTRRLTIRTADAEATLVPLVRGGYRAAGLRVTGPRLEDAFWQLTHESDIEAVIGAPTT